MVYNVRDGSTLLLFFFVLIIMVLSLSAAADTFINEIMYNPSGSDNNREFVEIYSDTVLNLSRYSVGDTASNDTLIMLLFVPGSFSLIVEEGFDYSGINASVYSAGATIGNNLNNGEDTVFLYGLNGTLIDSVSYTSTQGGNGNNRSLELFNGTWNESLVDGGTPGAANSIIPLCVASLVNTSWSNWTNQTECLINNTIIQNRSLIQYDKNFCGSVENTTYWESNTSECDYCVPSWNALNTSCQDSIVTQWYNDTNGCYALTNLSSDSDSPANETFDCSVPAPVQKPERSSPSSGGGGGSCPPGTRLHNRTCAPLQPPAGDELNESLDMDNRTEQDVSEGRSEGIAQHAVRRERTLEQGSTASPEQTGASGTALTGSAVGTSSAEHTKRTQQYAKPIQYGATAGIILAIVGLSILIYKKVS